MRKLLRRRIRAFFGLQAIALFVMALRSLILSSHSDHALRRYGYLIGFALLSMVYAKAWRTTYRPPPSVNPWAIGASLISISGGLYMLWEAHTRHTFAVPGLIAIGIGIGGLYIYAEHTPLTEPQAGA